MASKRPQIAAETAAPPIVQWVDPTAEWQIEEEARKVALQRAMQAELTKRNKKSADRFVRQPVNWSAKCVPAAWVVRDTKGLTAEVHAGEPCAAIALRVKD